MDVEPQTKPTAPDEIEPKGIVYIGGPWNGKKRRDDGENQRITWAGDLYKRVQMDVGDNRGRIDFEVMAYFGKSFGA